MRVAVIGTGISGLSAAWLIGRRHQVDLFEQNDYVGGHSRTVGVREGGRTLPIDTGFIVYNERTYPLLTRLFSRLGVTTQPADMAFGVRCDRCRLEYASTARGLFATPASLLSIEHHRMIAAMFRFFRLAPEVLDSPRHESMTLGAWLAARRFPEVFRRHFVTPLGGAVWSTSPSRMYDFPVAGFVRFFQNHGFLGVTTSPQWRTVTGGSREYVERLTAGFRDRIRLNTPVAAVRRPAEGGVEIEEAGGARHRYDAVVMAAHADQSLRMLADPSADERRILSAIPYTANEAVLHTDDSLLPRRRAARSSWNIRLADCRAETPKLTMTYDLSRLQSVDSKRTYCVTLNDAGGTAPASRIETRLYEHPHFTVAGYRAQQELAAINGRRNSWFCGAWTRYGFHEDGLMSGVAVARAFGEEF